MDKIRLINKLRELPYVAAQRMSNEEGYNYMSVTARIDLKPAKDFVEECMASGKLEHCSDEALITEVRRRMLLPYDR